MMKTVSVSMLSFGLLLGAISLLTVTTAGCSGQATTAKAAEPWCEEHGVEERLCTICHPEIKDDPNVLKCAEHDNIPEELCTICHPELKTKYKTCPHDLPVAFCKQCGKGEKK